MSECRTGRAERATKETRITAEIDLDGAGRCRIDSGIAFLDHMLEAMCRHAGIDLTLECEGDLGIDDHHTAEDCGLVLGMVIDRALGERRGIARFGHAYAPLDEALARAVVDLSGRPMPVVDLGLTREFLGSIACENITHVLVSMAMNLRAAVHVDVLRGTNDHHRAEAAFKALGLALRSAVARTRSDQIPSTKGVL